VRIAFVGKGAAQDHARRVVTRYLAELDRPVLAIDADINQHLGAR